MHLISKAVLSKPQKQSTPAAELPEGFRYQPDFVGESEEAGLLRVIQDLEFQPFDFHGYQARRRIVEYGWEYDFRSRKASTAALIPDFLIPLRERAARFAGVAPEALVEAVITEYPPGAPIGWHRDVPQFETILGISLASEARMRLKPYRAEGKLVSVILQPRSILCNEWTGALEVSAQHPCRRKITLFNHFSNPAQQARRSSRGVA